MSDSRAIHTSLSSRLLSVLPCYADSASERAPVAQNRSVLASLAGPAWDAAAMFAGTGAWLAVYYAGPSFAKMDDDGPMSFILHCIAMGVTANLVVLPLVKRNHLSRGETNRQANAEIKKYFILCTIPDVLYEPVADWLAAMSTKGSVTGIDFKKYADPNFDAAEVSGAILLFGLGFGSIYYLGGKFLERNSAEKEADPEIKFHADDTQTLRILRKVLEIYETDAMSAGIAALQYFIFYLTDYLFDVDWYSFGETMPQILGMCAMMGAYTFLFDAGPVFLRALIEKLETAPEDPMAYRLLTGDAISNEVRALFPAERNRRPSNSGFFENRNLQRPVSTATGSSPGSITVATSSFLPPDNDTAVTVRTLKM